MSDIRKKAEEFRETLEAKLYSVDGVFMGKGYYESDVEDAFIAGYKLAKEKNWNLNSQDVVKAYEEASPSDGSPEKTVTMEGIIRSTNQFNQKYFPKDEEKKKSLKDMLAEIPSLIEKEMSLPSVEIYDPNRYRYEGFELGLLKGHMMGREEMRKELLGDGTPDEYEVEDADGSVYYTSIFRSLSSELQAKAVPYKRIRLDKAK